MAATMTIIGTWIGVFFTISIFSFLFKDNPFYKFAEQVFIGLSAGYGLIYLIYNVLIPNLFHKLIFDFSHNVILLIPATLGLLMLMRLIPSLQWLSKYPLAVVIGTAVGISMLRYMQSDFLNQLTATMINPLAGATKTEIVGNFLLIIGTICGIYFFYFSRKKEGVYAIPSKIGIWFLMVSFGASFGYTVMARVSLLIGRLEFLLKDWLHIIR